MRLHQQRLPLTSAVGDAIASKATLNTNCGEKLSQMVKSGEVYTCKMHNEVMGDRPGKCPKCGMDLVKQKITEAQKKMWKEGTYIKPNY